MLYHHIRPMNDTSTYKARLKGILSTDELKNFSKDNESIIELGYDCVDSGDFRKAFQLFSIGARIKKIDPDILNGLGISLCELGKLKSSRKILEKAASLYPEDAITLANLAGVYWELNDYDKAKFYYYQSIQYDATITEAHINLINLYFEGNELYMAFITCNNFLKQYPEDPEALELMEEIILQIGLTII